MCSDKVHSFIPTKYSSIHSFIRQSLSKLKTRLYFYTQEAMHCESLTARLSAQAVNFILIFFMGLINRRSLAIILEKSHPQGTLAS